MRKRCVCVAVGCLLLVVACGKDDKGGGGGGSVETEMMEVPFGDVVVKGKLPAWGKNSMGELALKETVDGIEDMVVAAIGFNSMGGSGVDEAKMKAHIESEKAQAIAMEIGGAKPEVVEDIAEVAPGVLSYATKAKDFGGDSFEYTVHVWHLPKEGGEVMYDCYARSRLTKEKLWKALKTICAEVEFVAK